MIRISVIIIMLGIIVGLIIALSVVISQRDDARHSAELWHSHAMAATDWRMDHYESDYSYLTKGKSDDKLGN